MSRLVIVEIVQCAHDCLGKFHWRNPF